MEFLLMGMGLFVFGSMIFGVLIFNGLVGRKNEVQNTLSTVDVYLKKRYDLIPNLVSTVQGYVKHERTVLEEITRLRAQAMKGQDAAQKIDLNNQLSRALAGLMVTVENYPELKSSQNFMALQVELVKLEENLAAARRTYNAAATSLNNLVCMFPSNLIAGMANFKKVMWFEAPSEEKVNPSVKNLLAA